MKISIVLPVYNSADILEDSVKKVERAIKKYDYEIIIAEDGSLDGTDKIAEKIAEKNKKIVHLHSRKRLGKGLALKNAFERAKGDVLIFTDIDLSGDLSLIPVFFDEIINGSDICVANRYLSSSQTERTFLRNVATISYNIFVKILFNTKLTDLQCGYKAFHARTLPILTSCKNNSWSWDTEVLLKAEKMGLKIKEIPVRWIDSKKSKVNIIRDSFRMLCDLLIMKRII